MRCRLVAGAPDGSRGVTSDESEGTSREGTAVDHIRTDRDRLVMDGAFGAIYVVDTVEVIDANLESLHWRPSHPDIDRLLDARRVVGALRAIFPLDSGEGGRRPR